MARPKKETAPAAEKATKVKKAPNDNKAAAPKAPKAPKPEPIEAKSPTHAGETKVSKNVVDTSRYHYEVSDMLTASGRKSRDSADDVAQALRGMDVDAVFEAVVLNGGAVKDSWRTLNGGLARMAAGNALRGLLTRNKKVVIGTVEISLPEVALAA